MINEFRKRTIALEDKGEEFYHLLDPITDGRISGYMISTNGNILSNKQTKSELYKRRKIVIRKNKRSHIKLAKNNGECSDFYISDLVARNFLGPPSSLNPNRFIVNGKYYYREYQDPKMWYIIFKDADVTNHKLSNILYASYIDYIYHCKRSGQKVNIKKQDIDLMIRIYEENKGTISKAEISRLVFLHDITFSIIYANHIK